jgi:hypothetical protein
MDKAEAENILCKHLNGQAAFKVTLANNTQGDEENSGPGPRKGTEKVHCCLHKVHNGKEIAAPKTRATVARKRH